MITREFIESAKATNHLSQLAKLAGTGKWISAFAAAFTLNHHTLATKAYTGCK